MKPTVWDNRFGSGKSLDEELRLWTVAVVRSIAGSIDALMFEHIRCLPFLFVFLKWYVFSVDVKEEDREDFKLEKFETVTCKNSLVNDDGNVVIDEASATSVITETHDIAATIGAKNFDGDRESSDAAISFSTVVTNSLFPTDKTVASSIVCEGTVEMVVEITTDDEDDVPQRRRSQRRHLLSFGLRAPSSSSSSSSSVVSTAATRRLQADADQANAGTFGTTIQLNALVSSSSSSSSPKFLSSLLCSVVTGMVLIPSMTSMVMMTMT